MKKLILGIVISFLLIASVSVIAEEEITDSWVKEMYQNIWYAVADLQNQINNLQSGAVECPSDMIDAGNYCIDPSKSTEAVYVEDAILSCYDGGKRLCSAQEISYACLKKDEFGITDFFIDWEGEFSGDSHGMGGFTFFQPLSTEQCGVFYDNQGWENKFRCCKDK